MQVSVRILQIVHTKLSSKNIIKLNYCNELGPVCLGACSNFFHSFSLNGVIFQMTNRRFDCFFSFNQRQTIIAASQAPTENELKHPQYCEGSIFLSHCYQCVSDFFFLFAADLYATMNHSR